MIESNIIKRFIVKSFMRNSESEIEKIAEITFNLLNNKFLLNENVIIPSLEEFNMNERANVISSGKIVKCNRDFYVVQMSDNSRVEIPIKEIKRKTTFELSDIYSFIDSITRMTPLGRIVIENVFDKITQPGFGMKGHNEIKNDYKNRYRNDNPFESEINNESNYYENTKGLQKRPERGSNLNSVFQNVEIRNQMTPKAKPEEVPVEIKTEAFKKVEILGFEGKNLEILIKIYTFFTSLKMDQNVNKIKRCFEEKGSLKSKPGNMMVDLKAFADLLCDPEYSNETIFLLHKYFIEAIEKDIVNCGYRFVNELFLMIDRLPSYSGAPAKELKKKRNVMDKDNWKNQVKNFIFNFSMEVNSDKPLRFLDFAKRELTTKESSAEHVENENAALVEPFPVSENLPTESINLKLEFLDFLYKVYTYSETAKSMVLAIQNIVKANKPMKFKEDEPGEESSNTEHPAIFLDNPLLANIGKFRNFYIFLSHRTILLGDKFEYFILEQKDLNLILKVLNGLSKTEKSTMTNLRAIVNELY